METLLSISPHMATRVEETKVSKYEWISTILVIISVLIQVKIHFMWSESRILRKLRAEVRDKGPEGIRNEIHGSVDQECTSNEVFAKLYMRLSKGRHRHMATLYFRFFMISTFVIGELSFLQIGEAMMSSDTLIAFRIAIAVGSLTVLGARPLSKRELLVLVLALVGYILAIVLCPFYMRSYGFWLAHTIGFFVLTGCIIFLEICLEFCRYRDGGTHLADICSDISKRKYRVLAKQDKRMQHMRTVMKTEGGLRGTKNGRYWSFDWVSWVYVIVYVISMASNLGVMHDLFPNEKPDFVIIQATDFRSFTLLMINSTQVEPTLMIELLQIADGYIGDGAEENDLHA